MVDLMMWLVIAALLLAAAIQGIGYYQKAAYLYHVKNDVMGGVTKVVSVSGNEHNGRIDESIVADGLNITDTTKNVVLEADTDPNGSPMIRGTHPGIPGKEVVYLFEPYGTYQSENVIVIDAGEIPQGSSEDTGTGETDPEAGSDLDPENNVPASPYPVPVSPDGDLDNDGVTNKDDPDMNGDGVPNTAREEFNTVQESVYAGDTTTFTNPDGSVTQWNADDSGTYSHTHAPIMDQVFPAGKADITRIQRDDWRTLIVTYGTDGTVTNGDGAVGYSFAMTMHADLTCQRDDGSLVTYRFPHVVTTLGAQYGGPPPEWHLDSTKILRCEGYNEDVVGAVFRPTVKVDHQEYYQTFNFTRDIVVKWAATPSGLEVVDQ